MKRWVIGVLAVGAILAIGIWLVLPGTELPLEEARPHPGPEPPSTVDPQIRARIDRWIEDHQLNRFGDPPATRYPGGDPTFDSRSTIRRDRYEYILEKHPELKTNAARP